MLLCLAPGSARADSLRLLPYWKEITLSDTWSVASIAVYADGTSGAFHLIKTFSSDHSKKQKIVFEVPEDATHLYVEVTMENGSVRTSQAIDCTKQDQRYTYNVKRNNLTEEFISPSSATEWAALLTVLFIMVVLLLAFAVLVVFLTALPFRLKPYKPVILATLIAQPLMYLVRIIGSYRSPGGIIMLGVLVVVSEYFYYAKKYSDRSKGILFGYTLLSNLLCWILGQLIFG